MTWLGLAQRKNDIFMHMAVLRDIFLHNWFKHYIIMCIYGQLYQVLVSKICMQCYLVTMTMKNIHVFIKMDIQCRYVRIWSPMYSEWVYTTFRIYKSSCIFLLCIMYLCWTTLSATYIICEHEFFFHIIIV